ncbi:hypothetical protein CCM_02820 [Cordyceps militaris CM01]|uniref:Uncharacterized protein n=1 Tax=Cordyceps militaris (strain CM01) TaxID=983644 RepID=G3JC34_CORMM|nr:uncharacterized protein CCM_02820 [Cordyceps militaris CM01]EGX94549.1 hypothetical protein CCM_02820 [Cordyceps militaris CM01]
MSDNHNVASSASQKEFGHLAPWHRMVLCGSQGQIRAITGCAETQLIISYSYVLQRQDIPVQSTSFPYSPPYVHIEACLETATKACPAQPPVHNLVTQLGS